MCVHVVCVGDNLRYHIPASRLLRFGVLSQTFIRSFRLLCTVGTYLL